ncbi:tachylectin-related carbohydrate-binding protein [Actinophytocola oryzae]|uniref:tachylectin-related carbohydrate-binding protein n=1 Tax=Actinophytocola oryzae TaxID=502181 RepID=UPI0014152781|nr:tachylectin-related carbohydrate-binding protein [Actinophytocola oryzae]
MLHYHHLEPENGVLSWDSNVPTIGLSWQTGRAVAGPDGVIYAPWNTGELRRYRWVNNAWEMYNGAWYRTVDATGWDRYTTADYKNRITVDAEGHIYTVEPDGALHWRAFDATTGTWRHRVIAGGWSQYNLIFAAGRGIIYGRLPNGNLHRYRYHAASNRWIGTVQDIGRDWQRFDRVFSAGGDILYAIEPDGEMFWYRWNEDTDSWAAQTGGLIGRGWLDLAATAQPDACQRVGTTVPARPAVPAQPNGAVTLLGATDGHVHLSYVDSEGRAVHGEAADLSGGTPVGVAVVPGFVGATATTATGEYQDGRVALLATGTDADTRESILGANDAWSTPTNEGGYLRTAPTVARLSTNQLAAYALDADYNLWTRQQPSANAPLDGWRFVGATPLAHERLTVVPNSLGGVQIIGLGRNGVFQTAVFNPGSRSTWAGLGGSAFAGSASAVTMPDGKLQVFAVDSAGVVQTQRQGATGFPGTWTAVGGVTAAGSPSAIMAPDGTLQVVVRGVDGYLYYAGQTAPGATTFNPWRIITTADQTSTDPTALAVPSASTWVVAYVTDTGLPKLRRYNPPVGGRSAEAFVDLPVGG